jgi:hypothetical protein
MGPLKSPQWRSIVGSGNSEAEGAMIAKIFECLQFDGEVELEPKGIIQKMQRQSVWSHQIEH